MAHLRVALALGALLAAAPTVGVAQRVGLDVGLTRDTLVDGKLIRLPTVRVVNLLAGRWGAALRSSYPLRLSYQIGIWRSRDGWIDAYERTVEWSVLIKHEALFDQYTVTIAQPRGQQQEATLPTWEALELYLGRQALILARPAGTGTYYFHVKLVVTTLSESDLDELERFMSGEGTNPDRDRNPGGRSVMQFLLRMTGGLQTETVEQRTEKFVVR